MGRDYIINSYLAPQLLEEGQNINTRLSKGEWYYIMNSYLAPQLLEEGQNKNTAGLSQGWEGIT